MQMPRIGAGPTFHRVQGVAVRVGVLIGPRICVLEPDGVDHKRVALPTADFLAEVGRVRILRVLAAIRWNETESPVLIEKNTIAADLQQLEAAIAGIFAGNAAGEAAAFGIDGVLYVITMRGLASGRERQPEGWQILTDVAMRLRV